MELDHMKKIGIGYEDYKDFTKEKMYYVDKTLLIRDIVDKGGKTTLFTRPRRFGKTLALSMLRTFFELEYDRDGNTIDNRRYFEGMRIMEAGDEILSMMGQYPVINLSLKSAKQSDFYNAFTMLRREIMGEYDRHGYLAESELLAEGDKKTFRELRWGELDWEEKRRSFKDKEEYDTEFRNEVGRYATSLKILSELLKKHHNKNVIILIDEYDVPLENSWFRGFYDEMVDFIRSLFESALKTNNALERSVVTGCLRISKESIFTGLNNLVINSILTPDFGEYFGFTDDEVKAMLDSYGLPDKYEEVRDWYNGYLFGDKNVYNPWSTVLYISDHIGSNRNYFPVSYWANTSSNSIVRELVERADDETKKELERLIEGGSIEKPVHEDITYGEIYTEQDNLWNFMFFTGYLRLTGERIEGEKRYCTMVIPNRETRYIYSEKIRSWFKLEVVDKTDRSALFNALKQGDAETLEQEINKLLRRSVSYMDSYENFYHGFMTGILLGGDGYTVKSNRESVDGRSDILIRPVDIFDRAFVIELKTVKPEHKKQKITMEMMDLAAEEALKQIVDRNYMEALEEDGYPEAGRYGISFFGKRCRVHYAQGYPDEE